MTGKLRNRLKYHRGWDRKIIAKHIACKKKLVAKLAAPVAPDSVDFYSPNYVTRCGTPIFKSQLNTNKKIILFKQFIGLFTSIIILYYFDVKLGYIHFGTINTSQILQVQIAQVD